jgi:hypothetical protein
VRRDEAEKLCQLHAREHPDRETHTWIPREAEQGQWGVVRVPLPADTAADRLVAAVEGRPVPPADLRPLIHQHVPPLGATGGDGDGD